MHMNSVDTCDYMDTCTDFRNQGATNTANVAYIHAQAVIMINVGLAQAHPNYYLSC